MKIMPINVHQNNNQVNLNKEPSFGKGINVVITHGAKKTLREGFSKYLKRNVSIFEFGKYWRRFVGAINEVLFGRDIKEVRFVKDRHVDLAAGVTYKDSYGNIYTKDDGKLLHIDDMVPDVGSSGKSMKNTKENFKTILDYLASPENGNIEEEATDCTTLILQGKMIPKKPEISVKSRVNIENLDTNDLN